MDSSTASSPVRLSDLTHPVVAGLISVIVNYGGTFILVFQAAKVAGLSTELTASWVWSVSIGVGVTGLILSWVAREPIITAFIFLPQDYVGPVITLCNQKRGSQIDMRYHGRQVQMIYELPLSEVVFDFFDKLKSVSRGYASLDYEFKEYRPADMVKLDVLINGDKVDALSLIVHRSSSVYRGRELVSKMRELIPRQMYDVAIQAALGAQIIARETVKAMRKDVLAKCYGGDISRKKKLLEKQKAGKKRMKQIGTVEVPQEAFLAVLRVDGK